MNAYCTYRTIKALAKELCALCKMHVSLIWGVTKFIKKFSRFSMKSSQLHYTKNLVNLLCPLVIKDWLI